MELTDMAIEIMSINQDIIRRRKVMDKYDVYDFDQTWASTALGFGGCGGSALTTARTYVLIPMYEEKAYVYFGGRFAYECGINDEFRKDIKSHNMADVMGSGKYNRKDSEDK